MNKLNKKQLLIISFTFFSMLFGAGNLIFPPFLGVQMGDKTFITTLGMLLSAVILPIVCVFVISKHGSFINLTNSIHPLFTIIYTSSIYILLGPIIATPRTASTSFEMAIVPFFKLSPTNLFIARIAYSIIFFTLSFFVAKNPGKLKDFLGKIMSPILLILILIMFFSSIYKLEPNFAPAKAHSSNAFFYGLETGYQTLDMLAALIYGIIISLNIKSFGLNDKKIIAKETIKAGIITGIMLIVIYSMTAYIGALSSSYLNDINNGAIVLTFLAKKTFGFYGQMLLGIIFFIACFNVCTGLIASCSEYFSSIFPKISYMKWLIFTTVFSLLVSITGLDFILKFTIPILKLITPISLLVMVYGLIKKSSDESL